MITIFQDIFAVKPFYVKVEKALERIKQGSSRERVLDVRQQIDKERANNIKTLLPSVCFSGKFSKRTDDGLIKHSGYMVLDFDHVQDVEQKKGYLSTLPFVKAAWVSPGGNGVKALILIGNGSKHREHFEAIKQQFPDVDKSGGNVSRVCYESWDENIYIAESCKPFTDTVCADPATVTNTDSHQVFQNILKWLANKHDAFVKGERNHYTFKLASACCRFGIMEDDCRYLFHAEFPKESDFSEKEAAKTIRSAYRINANSFNSASFDDNQQLIDSRTQKEVEIDPQIYDLTIPAKDVIFGEDVKADALNLYRNGYEQLFEIGVPEMDEYFKLKRCEITLLSGIGNYGKSTFLNWYLLMRAMKFGEKFAFFTPENNPAHEFYHDLVEIAFGKICTPPKAGYFDKRPNEATYSDMYDIVSKHFFYVYPKDNSPTPDYVKERFLELIIKQKIDGCIIDPFNQLSHAYGSRADKYLEHILADCSRFAQQNNIYFLIVAHPKALQKQNDGNYPCPDVFDIADGAMWNNKMDNILIYHRPNHQQDPNSTQCQLHTKKIRRQKIVGQKGTIDFDYMRSGRRFFFGGRDYMHDLLEQTNHFRPDRGEQSGLPF